MFCVAVHPSARQCTIIQNDIQIVGRQHIKVQNFVQMATKPRKHVFTTGLMLILAVHMIMIRSWL